MQRSLFDLSTQPEKRPLPELIASGGTDWDSFPLAFQDVDGHRFYAVQDWIRGIAQTDNPRRFWTDMKAHYPELYERCVQLKYLASDGKRYKVDHVEAEGLYSITQAMGAKTGIAQRVRDYLSAAGVRLDQYRLNGSLAVDDGIKTMMAEDGDTERVNSRVKGIIGRNIFTQGTTETHITHTPKIGVLTAQEYNILFGRAKSQIVQELKLTKSQADNHFRDHLDTLALQAIDAIERACAVKMRQMKRLLTDAEQEEIVITVSRMVAGPFRDIASYLGTDLATGRPQLTKGKK